MSLKQDFKNQILELRGIINLWNLIPECPDDEFDSLNHKILGSLNRAESRKMLVNIILDELTSNYGFEIEEKEAKEYSIQIMNWWNNRN